MPTRRPLPIIAYMTSRALTSLSSPSSKSNINCIVFPLGISINCQPTVTSIPHTAISHHTLNLCKMRLSQCVAACLAATAAASPFNANMKVNRLQPRQEQSTAVANTVDATSVPAPEPTEVANTVDATSVPASDPTQVAGTEAATAVEATPVPTS